MKALNRNWLKCAARKQSSISDLELNKSKRISSNNPLALARPSFSVENRGENCVFQAKLICYWKPNIGIFFYVFKLRLLVKLPLWNSNLAFRLARALKAHVSWLHRWALWPVYKLKIFWQSSLKLEMSLGDQSAGSREGVKGETPVDPVCLALQVKDKTSATNVSEAKRQPTHVNCWGSTETWQFSWAQGLLQTYGRVRWIGYRFEQ